MSNRTHPVAVPDSTPTRAARHYGGSGTPRPFSASPVPHDRGGAGKRRSRHAGLLGSAAHRQRRGCRPHGCRTRHRRPGRRRDLARRAADHRLHASGSPPRARTPRFRTEARVAYDAANLYVFVRAFDPHPDSIIRLLERRDTFTPSDMIWVFVDSYHDRRTGYEFGVNAAGVKIDQAVYNDGNEDGAWDAVWDVATRIDSLGWTAEFRIPLSQMRYSTAALAHLRIHDRPRHLPVRRARELADVQPVQGGHGLPARDAGRPATTSRRRAAWKHFPYVVTKNASVIADNRFADRSNATRRRRPQVPRRVEPHARRDDQPRLRPGRVRPRGAQPHGLRIVLRRTPAVLRRRAAGCSAST